MQTARAPIAAGRAWVTSAGTSTKSTLVPVNEIISVGMGRERPLVTPDNTAAKKAKNRRYEIQVRL